MLDLMFETPGSGREHLVQVTLEYAIEKVNKSNINKLKVA
jgi:hypothetical protein